MCHTAFGRCIMCMATTQVRRASFFALGCGCATFALGRGCTIGSPSCGCARCAPGDDVVGCRIAYQHSACRPCIALPFTRALQLQQQVAAAGWKSAWPEFDQGSIAAGVFQLMLRYQCFDLSWTVGVQQRVCSS
jgi:hypothetical protein